MAYIMKLVILFPMEDIYILTPITMSKGGGDPVGLVFGYLPTLSIVGVKLIKREPKKGK